MSLKIKNKVKPEMRPDVAYKVIKEKLIWVVDTNYIHPFVAKFRTPDQAKSARMNLYHWLQRNEIKGLSLIVKRSNLIFQYNKELPEFVLEFPFNEKKGKKAILADVMNLLDEKGEENENAI